MARAYFAGGAAHVPQALFDFNTSPLASLVIGRVKSLLQFLGTAAKIADIVIAISTSPSVAVHATTFPFVTVIFRRTSSTCRKCEVLVRALKFAFQGKSLRNKFTWYSIYMIKVMTMCMRTKKVLYLRWSPSFDKQIVIDMAISGKISCYWIRQAEPSRYLPSHSEDGSPAFNPYGIVQLSSSEVFLLAGHALRVQKPRVDTSIIRPLTLPVLQTRETCSEEAQTTGGSISLLQIGEICG